MQRLPGARVVTIPDASTHVVTRAPENLRAFVRQRIRHLSTGRLFSPLHLAAGCAVYGFHMLLVLFLVFTVFSRDAGVLFIAVLAVKLVIDALAAWRVRTVLNLAVHWQRFLINELLLIGYMAIMPILGLLVPVRWKEK